MQSVIQERRQRVAKLDQQPSAITVDNSFLDLSLLQLIEQLKPGISPADYETLTYKILFSLQQLEYNTNA